MQVSIPGVRRGVPQPSREVVSAARQLPFHKIVDWDATAGRFAYDPTYDQKQPDFGWRKMLMSFGS
jgi:hypothetical protein